MAVLRAVGGRDHLRRRDGPPLDAHQLGAGTFVLTVSNTETEAVYSTTEFEVTFAIGNNTVIPNLNPATVPICPGSFNPCIMTGACSPATAQESQIQLCEDATSCSLPPG